MEKGSNAMMNFFPIKPFDLERLCVRMIESKDASGIFAIRNDLKMIKYSGIPQMLTMAEALNFVDTRIEGMKSNKWIYFVLADKETDALMGTICLFNFKSDEASCEIGYELLPSFQGNGYINDAMKAVMQFAFEELNVKRIDADISEDNIASIHVVERAGFVFSKALDEGYKLFSASSAKGLLST